MTLTKQHTIKTKEGVLDMLAFMKFQVEEASIHRWIESEKAGRDLGSDAAKEWVEKYAKDVRNWAKSSGKFLIENPQKSQ